MPRINQRNNSNAFPNGLKMIGFPKTSIKQF